MRKRGGIVRRGEDSEEERGVGERDGEERDR